MCVKSASYKKNISKRLTRKSPVFIVAELSGNHNSDIQRAYHLIDAAKEAGVDAIKLQTYTADTLTIQSKKKWFRISKGPWKGKTLYDLYKWAYTPWEWHKELFTYARKKGLIAFSTPFDTTAVDFLESLQIPMYKIASFENNDIQLLKKVAQTKKPIILSTGLADTQDIQDALTILKKYGSAEIALLHCISAYPAPIDEMNLSVIRDVQERFKTTVGLSDHSLGTLAATIAVSLGATIIEKHFTLSRKDGGPDAAFSLEPDEMKQLVVNIRKVERALGKPSYTPTLHEKENIVFKRSLFVVKDIRRGEKFTKENVRSIRPGFGLKPKYYNKILSMQAAKNISSGTPLTEKHITGHI